MIFVKNVEQNYRKELQNVRIAVLLSMQSIRKQIILMYLKIAVKLLNRLNKIQLHKMKQVKRQLNRMHSSISNRLMHSNHMHSLCIKIISSRSSHIIMRLILLIICRRCTVWFWRKVKYLYVNINAVIYRAFSIGLAFSTAKVI